MGPALVHVMNFLFNALLNMSNVIIWITEVCMRVHCSHFCPSTPLFVMNKGLGFTLCSPPPPPPRQVQCLEKQLQGVQLDRVLGTEMLVSPEHPYQAVLMRDLKAQVESLKTQGSGETSTSGGQATYEVYTRTEAAKFAHLSKVWLSKWVWSLLSCDWFLIT